LKSLNKKKIFAEFGIILTSETKKDMLVKKEKNYLLRWNVTEINLQTLSRVFGCGLWFDVHYKERENQGETLNVNAEKTCCKESIELK
jgi:hypothetical protein